MMKFRSETDMLRIKAEDPSRFAYVDGLIKEKWEFLTGPLNG